MEEKQKLLRQEILEKGYDPAKFYQYWESLNLQFQHVDYQQLKIIVQTYVQTLLKYEQQEDQQFNDFQTPSYNQNGKITQKNDSPAQSDVYVDFDWDLLMGKTTQKKQQSSLSTKKQLKKLPKQFEKKQKVTKDASITDTKRQKQANISKQPATKQVNLIQDLDISLVPNNTKNLRDQSQDGQNSIAIVQKSFSVTFKQIESESKKQKIKCLKLQQNILNHHKNVQINITNIEELQEDNSLINKLWKGNEYLYTIKTLGRNKNRSIGVSWEVKRKYSDFEWLRNTLLKFYPGIIVPPLPAFPKNKDKLPGQKKKLQNFLMDAYRCSQLRNSKYFQVFLSYGNFSDFEGFKKSTETVSKPKQLSNILNMKGEIDLIYGQNIQLFATGIQQYLNKSSQHLKNVKTILNEIKGFYDNISNCYTRLSNVFQLMSQQSCQFSEQKCFPKLTETYNQIASLISKHSKFCQEEKSNIDTYMISHFSYEKDRIDNMQTLIMRKSQFTTQLNKRQPKQQTSSGMFGKITGGVASLFGEKSQSLQIPSSNYQKLYKQVGFYNNQLLHEMIRCVEVMIESQIDHFSGYGISRIDSVDKLQKTWSEIMVELSKLNLSK